jgi:hypothetical protein
MGMRRYVQNHFVGPVAEGHAAGGLDVDGPNGFEMSLAMGGFVDEHVMRWDAAPDGRPYTSTSY